MTKANYFHTRLPIMVFGLFITFLISACASTAPENPVNVPESATPVSSQQNRQACPENKPQMCTMIYQPVCAIKKDGSSYTEASSCTACAATDVIAYSEGECLTSNADTHNESSPTIE